MPQEILFGFGKLEGVLERLCVRSFFLVCGNTFLKSDFRRSLDAIGADYDVFSGFSPNPRHSQARDGLAVFGRGGYGAIVAIGGGSAIDVAKCIRLDSGSRIPLVAIPTTAGSGSESTRHIVVYDGDGRKESHGEMENLPDYAILEPFFLTSLPLFQRKSTVLDALCQAIESWWSVGRTEESIGLSKNAISLLSANMEAYVGGSNDFGVLDNVMKASNFAGQAINITATTAPHAMSYELTSLYQIPHGNAVALTLPYVWMEMLGAGDEALSHIFGDIARSLGKKTPEEAIEHFASLLRRWDVKFPRSEDRERELDCLVGSVNALRLRNNPVLFTDETLRKIYGEVIGI